MSFLGIEALKAKIPEKYWIQAQANWDLLHEALTNSGVYDECNLAGAMANVAVETGYSFIPEEEHGSSSYFMRNYWDNPKVRRGLGNLNSTDAITFHGRGYIQLTGRNNYTDASKALRLDLVGNPELACEPTTAAKILVWYWIGHKLNKLCEQIPDARDNAHRMLIWYELRRRINGGLNGIAEYLECLKLLGILEN